MKNTIKKIVPGPIKEIIKRLMSYRYSLIGHKRISTSISDNYVYPDFCIKASTRLRIFSSFRRNYYYQQILEHVSHELGQAYLDEVKKNNPELLKNIDRFKENDNWGNPAMFDYPSIGKISPTTLRYIKVYNDLLSLFKPDGLRVCEIGVGYGGQCRIINSMSSPLEYTLVDIQPALMLAQRYLDNYILNAVIKYKTMNELETQQYDLLISNYAFSELPKSIQNVYLKKIILNAKKGYITYNNISPEYFKSYKREELLNLIPNSYIIEEKPLTHKGNCIIVWNNG
jgi:phospholipid N-methyltransferase